MIAIQKEQDLEIWWLTMSNLNTREVKELFARIFVLGIYYKINFLAFTNALAKSEFVKKIEAHQYDEYFNNSLKKIFFDITNR